ncbi:MAG: hypothetical protein ACYTF1_04560 [Planctomycetota bacterium]|jgi:hypothetical protein
MIQSKKLTFIGTLVAGLMLGAVCGANAQTTCETIDFNYTNGVDPYINGALGNPAEDNGWWGIPTTAGRVDVINASGAGLGEVRITGGSGALVAALAVDCAPCGEETSNSGNSSMWNIKIDGGPSMNVGLARWYGGTTWVKGRYAPLGQVTSQYTLTTSYTELKAVINVFYGTTEYWAGPSGSLVHLGTIDNGGGDMQSVTRIKIDTISNGGALNNYVYLDDISIERCYDNCSIYVTPTWATARTAAVGGVAYPSPVWGYEVINTGISVDPHYVVSETDQDGNAATYDWLSTDKAGDTILGGPLSTDTLGAQFSTGALPAGLYSGYLKFSTDNCTPDPEDTYIRPIQFAIGSDPCYFDAFPYPDGPLPENETLDLTWYGEPGIFVESEMVKLDFTDGDDGIDPFATQDNLECGPCEDGTITVVVDVKTSDPAGSGGYTWNLWYQDTSDTPRSFGRWYGFPNTAKPRVGSVGTSTTFTPGVWYELKVVIDTVNNRTKFYVDNVEKGDLSHGVDKTVAVNNKLGQMSALLRSIKVLQYPTPQMPGRR